MSDLVKILLGGLLAVIGGIFGKLISVSIDDRRERNYIKRSLSDELGEIMSIISKFSETYDNGNTLNPIYLDKLEVNTETYDSTRNRLFLISKGERRRAIINFYRDLHQLISDNKGKLGSLATPQGKTPEMNDIMNKFNALKGRADDIHKELNKWF